MVATPVSLSESFRCNHPTLCPTFRVSTSGLPLEVPEINNVPEGRLEATRQKIALYHHEAQLVRMLPATPRLWIQGDARY